MICPCGDSKKCPRCPAIIDRGFRHCRPCADLIRRPPPPPPSPSPPPAPAPGPPVVPVFSSSSSEEERPKKRPKLPPTKLEKERLKPGGWLDEEIIDNYLKIKYGSRHGLAFFNSHFLDRFEKYGYEHVACWTKAFFFSF